MTDTIELLEAIGSDASLRYARTDELKSVLEQVQASAELTAAVAAGDSSPLRVELGIQQVPQAPQTHAPGHGDDEEDGESDTPQQPDRAPPSSSNQDSSH
ncbi:hypothetical protein [Rhodanobacter sp. DHG33]|uniref:hypothetical protein n=1 Tax=Rhodanobacter sp. DHG33 TaxID=2775921 RepID=UPI0017801FB8|nr:hypothetical protein [Rhodanobacter sp. DHG33]MBD8899203.1 hypothetical protein [Rhodanobacter sp. DHG33]